MKSSLFLSCIVANLSNTSEAAFGTLAVGSTRPRTFLNLEDDVANMVDDEYYRLNHKDEYDENFKKNTKVDTVLPQGFVFSDDFNSNEDKRQLTRDKRLAEADPEKYCADRCLSTGSCEIYEDSFKMSPKEVIEFCSECVLSEDEEPCDVPDAFFPEDEIEEVLHP